jgi:4-amino-4-deoxy-L-arabinose transferase-like glycosyltransferase
MDIDASQYASISRELLDGKSWLQFYDLGADYLDKPPMLFWLSSLSLKIFGIYDWAYRLPSFLFALLAVYATHALAFQWYGKNIARLSAMVLATSQAFFLITHDVRTDTMLMGWVILSIWQLSAWYQNGKWVNFIWAFIAIAGGMMTKGPIALIVPVLAFLPHFLLKREWKQLFRWEYLVGLVIIAILLIPMSIGLYEQYDLHPGKLINGRPIQSGLRFYYWTQSFGRYTGENMYHEMSYFSFLLENMLWSFLPWILFFLAGLALSIWQLIPARFWLSKKEEWISSGGFVFTYCILARSQAQLPHYIFVVFPFAAIVTAVFLDKLFFANQWTKLRKIFHWFHVFIFLLLWIAVIVLMKYPFPNISILIPILAMVGLVVFVWIVFRNKSILGIPPILVAAIYTVIGVNLCLNTQFYPHLLQFQMGNTAADFINQNGIDKQKIVLYGAGDSRALHFYGKHIFLHKSKRSEIAATDILLTSSDSLSVFQLVYPAAKLLHKGPNFSVSILTAQFLNPVTREQEVPHYVILDLDGKP